MKTRALLVLFRLLATLPTLARRAEAQKVYVDYDRATAFSEYKTYQLVETQEDLRDFSPTLHGYVMGELRRYTTEGGLVEVTENPDFYLAYYTADRGNLRLVMSDLRYAYGPDFDLGGYWEGGVGDRDAGMGSFTFKEGTLVVDAWEAESNRLVWRGIATAALSKKPEKNEKKLERALQKIMDRWEKAHGGYVRAVREIKAEQGDQE